MASTGDESARPRDVGRQSGFRDLVGYRTEVWRENYAEIVLDIEPKHLNNLGILHGGVYMAILDAAMGHASTWCSVEGNVRRCVTISLTTAFLSSVKAGTIRAIARCTGIADRLATCDGEIRDGDGRLLITGQGSFRYARGSDRPEGVPRHR